MLVFNTILITKTKYFVTFSKRKISGFNKAQKKKA